MYYRRTLILNDINSKYSSKKGVITLENSDNVIKGQLRLYNFKEYPQNVAIGITSGSDIIKVPINPLDNIVEFNIDSSLNLQEKLSCAMVDITELTKPQIIIGGTSNYLNDWADRVEQAFVEDTRLLEREEIYDISTEEIEKEISTVLRQDQEYQDCSKCINCKYKQAFFEREKQEKTSQESQLENNIEKIEEILKTATLENSQVTNTQNSDLKVLHLDSMIEDKEVKNDVDETTASEDKLEKQEETQETFYDQIKDQIDDLFAKHSREETLESLIPGSKWVKVEYQDVEGYYVMGLVYDEDKLMFISYGLPAISSNDPPKDLVEYAQWLPTTENAEGEGYWLVYQSAENGESIKVE